MPEFSDSGGSGVPVEGVFDPDMSFANDLSPDEDDLGATDSLPVVELSALGDTPPNPMDAGDLPDREDADGEPDAEAPAISGGGVDDTPPPTDSLPSPVPEEPDRPMPVRIPLPPIRLLRGYDLEISRGKADTIAQREKDALGGYWDAIDSSLETGDHSFESWFREVLPPGESLKEYIVNTLALLDHRLGVELGGPGSQMFSEFPDGFFEETAGVALTDPRGGIGSTSSRFQIMECDDARNHWVIKGNIIAPQTKEEIDRWLNGRKLGLVMERMFAGAETLPKDPFTLAENVNHWYERLAEGGLMFAQVPAGLQPMVNEWKQMLDNGRYPLDVQIGNHEGYGLVRIHKLPGAPESLPLISARTLMKRRWDSRKGE
ncbi:MAG TPA: hypothetical protein VF809_00945 [Candidatus Saccharimonadales bacterium]